MNSFIQALGSLSLKQSFLLGTIIVSSFCVVTVVYFFLLSSSEQSLMENQREIPVQFGTLDKEVHIDGSISFSEKISLTFGSKGVVARILVEEGDRVAVGDELLSLDEETVASLEENVAKASIDLAESRFALELVTNFDEEIIEAQLDVAEAGRDVEESREKLEAFENPDSIMIAKAKVKVAKAELALTESAESVDSAVADAVNSVEKAALELLHAEKSLLTSRDSRPKDLALDALSTAREDYLNVVYKWTGVNLDEEMLSLSITDLFNQWNFDAESVYSRDYKLFKEGVVEDRNDTVWNELTVHGWMALHPSSGSVQFECVTSKSKTSASTAAQSYCIYEELEDARKAFEETSDDLHYKTIKLETAILKAELAVKSAKETLQLRESSLKLLEDGLQMELLESDMEEKEALLEEAHKELADLMNPDVSEYLVLEREWELANTKFKISERQLEMISGQKEKTIAYRSAIYNKLLVTLEAAESRLRDSILLAPSNGLVSNILVSEGDEILPNATVIEVLDDTVVYVNGIVDEIDVLNIEKGDPAKVSLDALPGVELGGLISKISTEANGQQGLSTYDVEVELVVPRGIDLQNGLTALATVTLGQKTGLLIPNQAIQGNVISPNVLVSRDDELVSQAVVLGDTDGFWTIVEEGLRQGDLIVIDADEASVEQLTFRGFGGPGRQQGVRGENNSESSERD